MVTVTKYLDQSVSSNNIENHTSNQHQQKSNHCAQVAGALAE